MLYIDNLIIVALMYTTFKVCGLYDFLNVFESLKAAIEQKYSQIVLL